MNLEHNIVTHSHNHCCSGNTTIHSCVAELHITVNYTKILCVTQQHFYVKCMPPATTKHM